jgi:protein-tyrosine-phosphatase
MKVVFVCAHGAAKSVLAGSYFNLLAEQAGIDARAVARGTEPDAEIAQRVRADAETNGVALCASQPTRLDDADVESADVLIAFDVQVPPLERSRQHLAWDGLPALSEDFDSGKAAILSRVEGLVADLRQPDPSAT